MFIIYYHYLYDFSISTIHSIMGNKGALLVDQLFCFETSVVDYWRIILLINK